MNFVIWSLKLNFMKTIVFLFLIMSSFAFGQFAKKRHKLLLVELAFEQQKQEDAIAFFKKKRAEFDSIKLLTNDQIGFLKKGEKRVLDNFFTYSGLLYQLKELESDLPPLIGSFKSEKVPVTGGFVEPIRKTLNTVYVFEKVSDKTDLGDLSRKEQNKVLSKKLNEYKRYALSNSVILGEMKASQDRISAFLPRLDSLQKVYETLANDMTSDSWKMQDKLNQLEAGFRKKGPKGYPEAYFRIFPEVFPGFLPAEKELELNGVPERIEFEDSYPVAVEHNEPEIFDWTEEAAAFRGGRDQMNAFITENLRYPESVTQSIISGKVYVKFIVSATGEISNVEVLRGIPACPECGEEAIRLVKSMPNWFPGKQNGKSVSSYVRLPLKFEL